MIGKKLMKLLIITLVAISMGVLLVVAPKLLEAIVVAGVVFLFLVYMFL